MLDSSAEQSAGNRFIFCLSAFYASQGAYCCLATMTVELGCYNLLTGIEVAKVVKVLWPLKLLPRKTHVDLSAFPDEVVESFAHGAEEIDETLVQASKTFAELYLVEDSDWKTHRYDELYMCDHLHREVLDKKLVKLGSLGDYIGPDSGSALAAFLDMVERDRKPLICPLWDLRDIREDKPDDSKAFADWYPGEDDGLKRSVVAKQDLFDGYFDSSGSSADEAKDYEQDWDSHDPFFSGWNGDLRTT